MAFPLVLLAATAGVLAAGFVPVRFAGAFFTWGVAFGSAWWYVAASAARIAAQANPAGYSLGVGALLGASAFVCAALVRVAYGAAILHRSPRELADPWGLVFLVAGMVFTAAFGAAGALAAGLRLPGIAPAANRPVVIGVAIAVVLFVVAAAAVVAYVIALAKAMSDAPG